MNLFGRRWEPDGLDALSPTGRLILSMVVTGAVGYLLEYIGTEQLGAFANSDPRTIYGATAVWAFGLGPLIVALRKASILVPMLIVGVLFMIVVLFNHYYFVTWQFSGGSFHEVGLWSPRIWEFREGAILGLHHPLLIALAAGAIETVVVPVSVLVQKLVTLKLRKPPAVPLEQVEELFESSVTPRTALKPRRDFGFVFMRIIFFAYGIYFAYMLIGLLVGGKGLPVVGMFFISPPETVNTIMKLTLMITLASVGAFNAGVRREAAILLTIGHSISVGASIWLFFAYPVNPVFPDDHNFLLSSVVGDGLLLVVLLYYVFKPRPEPEDLSRVEDVELRSPASSLLRLFFLVFGILFTVFSIGIVYYRAFGSPEVGRGAVFGGPDPLVSNSLTKYGTLAAFGYFLFAKPALRKYLTPGLVIAFSFSVVAAIIYGLQGTTTLITRRGTIAALPGFMMMHVIVDGAGLMLILGLRRLQYHVDYQIAALRPSSAECIMALHQAFRESSQEPEVSSREVLQRIDEHIGGLRSRRRGLISFPFWLVEHVFPFLSWFRPAFSTMSREEQRWMLRRYVLRPSYERAKATFPALAELMFKIGDITHALVTLAFFTTTRAAAQVGYVLPDARERLQSDIATDRPPVGADPRAFPAGNTDPLGRKPVAAAPAAATLLAPRVGVPVDSPRIPDEVDYCIVGSGAAGAVLAYRLAVARGKEASICVLERGSYYSPRQDFSDDEMRMIRMLYTEGGLQISRSFDFTILQGECVGGTTVINNAVCFQMPEVSRKEWKGFGIDVDVLAGHYARVGQEINIATVTPEAVNQNVENLFTRGVNGYNAAHNGIGKISPAQRLSGNFSNCLGCGLCNIGCRRMRKLSMLETFIPWSQANGVTVIPNVGAVQCETDNGTRKKVTGVVVRKPNGDFQRIRIRKALIVAAGAIASSRFLMRSNVGGDAVGKGLACNFALAPLVEFGDQVSAFDGLQMTMFAAPDSFDAIFETTFFPPGSHSIALPLYFDRHAAMMQSYRQAANFTALVGSDPGGTISRKRDVLFGRAVEWEQTTADMLRIKQALATIVRIAKAAGGKRILLPTHPVLEVDLGADVDETLQNFDRTLGEKSYFNFVTAHPQGGNLMAADSFDERVVDLDFRVRDCENLFVCDASIFPRGIRVNPQWTIMSLASEAAERIARMT
jgi:choline dehydrogenase-like flavoprotein